MNKKPPQQYTPERLALVVTAINQAALQVARQAGAMHEAKIESVSVGDAMLRRSYRNISRFAAAIERAIKKPQNQLNRTPWDEPDGDAEGPK